jgi:hypothetical protein
MQTEAQSLHQKNLESLESSLRSAREASQVGEATNVTLTTQEEQLRRIHDKTLDIDHNIKKSKGLVKGMSGFFGRVKGWFRSKPERKEVDLPKASEQPRAPQAAAVQTSCPPTAKRPELSAAATEHMRREHHLRQAVAEEDKVLDEVNEEVLRLQQIARDIGENLALQNQLLDTITGQVDTNDRSLQKVTAASKKLLR